MLVFEHLRNVDDRSMQRLIREVSTDDMMIALKGSDPDLMDKFLDNMSSRAADMLVEDMEAKGPVKLAEMTEAQKKILVWPRNSRKTAKLCWGERMTTSSPEAEARRAWSPPHLGETETVTVSSIRATLDSARQKGYDEGFEKGHAEGLAKAQAITADLEQLWEAMAQPFARQEEALFREQCLLVSRVAAAVLERELQTEPALIEAAVLKRL